MKAVATVKVEFDSPDAYCSVDVKNGIREYFNLLNPYIDNISIEPLEIDVNLKEKPSSNSNPVEESEESSKDRRMRQQVNAILLPMLNYADDKSKEAISWALRKISHEG